MRICVISLCFILMVLNDTLPMASIGWNSFILPSALPSPPISPPLPCPPSLLSLSLSSFQATGH